MPDGRGVVAKPRTTATSRAISSARQQVVEVRHASCRECPSAMMRARSSSVGAVSRATLASLKRPAVKSRGAAPLNAGRPPPGRCRRRRRRGSARTSARSVERRRPRPRGSRAPVARIGASASAAARPITLRRKSRTSAVDDVGALLVQEVAGAGDDLDADAAREVARSRPRDQLGADAAVVGAVQEERRAPASGMPIAWPHGVELRRVVEHRAHRLAVVAERRLERCRGGGSVSCTRLAVLARRLPAGRPVAIEVLDHREVVARAAPRRRARCWKNEHVPAPALLRVALAQRAKEARARTGTAASRSSACARARAARRSRWRPRPSRGR